MYRDKAEEKMREYFQDSRFVEHTLKVLSNAEKIYTGEGIRDDYVWNVVTLGSLFHDIGIPEALKKHGSLDAPYQEQEGPSVARVFMEEIGVRPDILERVCYIVGNHHTRERVDGLDFRIIWEADFIVNVDEGNITLDPEEVQQAVEENVASRTGRALINGFL
jgi:hypothetical protein